MGDCGWGHVGVDWYMINRESVGMVEGIGGKGGMSSGILPVQKRVNGSERGVSLLPMTIYDAANHDWNVWSVQRTSGCVLKRKSIQCDIRHSGWT